MEAQRNSSASFLSLDASRAAARIETFVRPNFPHWARAKKQRETSFVLLFVTFCSH